MDAAACSLVEESEISVLVHPGHESAARARGGWHIRAAVALAVLLVAGAAVAAVAARAPGIRAGRGAAAASAAAEGLLGLSQETDVAKAAVDGMKLVPVKDPCSDRKPMPRGPARRKAGRRLKEKADIDELLEEEKEEIEEVLEEEMVEIEGEEDPCKLPSEAVLKVQEVFDEEMEGAELAAHEKEVTYLEDELKALESAKLANHTGNSTAKAAAAANGTSRGTFKASSKEKAPGAASAAECSAGSEDCSSTKCCSDPGLQCYDKNKFWAKCREECVPGVPDPADVDADPWSCKELGKRTPGKVVGQEHCHDADDNCLESSKCCKGAGFACFTKNDTFGRCMPDCTPGPQYVDLDNGDPWTCHQAGPMTPSTVGEWTQEECSGDEDDCKDTRCCATSGFACYEMNEGWAQCKPSCSQEPSEDRPWEAAWTCTELGYRTPPRPAALPGTPPGGKVGRWVKDACSRDDEDCSDTSCCIGRGKQCYRRDDKYATCADECEKNSTWSCKELGARSFGLAYVGYPSLFCFSLLRVDTYELDLVKYQWEKRAGIFACDSFRVFSDTVTTIAGRKTLETPKVDVGLSKDGTAGNTLLFMKVWDMVFEDGTVWDHDWTIKADPDAVLLSDRLRGRLEPYTNNWDHGGRLFVVNCNAWPASADFPMMYGSVEIFSQGAMRQYMEQAGHCMEILPWEEWGEDYFLTHCMDQIDVGRLQDFNLVGDMTCTGPGQGWSGDCNLPQMAAFHPFKDIESWSECFDSAIR